MNLSLRHYYRRWFKNLILLFVITALLMTAARVGFVLHYGNVGSLLGEPKSLAKAFFLGFRYDLVPLAYIFAIPFLILHLMYVFPGRSCVKLTRFSLVSILCFGYFALIWLYVFDYAFYSYFQDHINILFFGFFEDDTVATLISVWKNYNLPLWLTCIFLFHYAIYRIIKMVFSMFDFDLRAAKLGWKFPVCFLAGLICLALFGRGNFTRLPLSFEDAHISTNEFINELSLNGVITLNRAIKIRKTYGKGQYNYLKKYGFNDWQGAYEATYGKKSTATNLDEALEVKSAPNEVARRRPPHVVMVVMESFGSYWNDRNDPQFQILGDLQKHFKDGILFKNFLSAENGTIGSIVSVATSSVIRPGARFLSESEFMRTELSSSGHLPFKDAGYDTHFIYGGKLGWRDLGKYLANQDYERLWGADEIKESMPELMNIPERELGNEWGIFDEYLYTFIEEQLKTATRPQFFLVLTTSNHPPFEWPSAYKPLPLNITPDIMNRMTVSPDLATKRFMGLQYSNQKMSEFLSRVKSSPYKDQMIVGLTGDHSYWITNDVGSDEEFKRYAVPFFISLPEIYKPANINTKKFGSHEDIFPTLYHLALSNQKYTKLGENMFTENSHAMNSSGLVANEHGAWHHGEFWKWKDMDKLILEPSPETPELKALHRHSLGMISITDLFLKEEKKRTSSDEGHDPQ